MRSLQRVAWSEGMFMNPQHLQQQDLYHEALLETRLGALRSRPWGVAALEIDTEALAAGQFQLLRFSGVLPDGLPVVFERGQPETPAARAVEEHFKATQKVLEVFLGVPREREGAGTYATGEGASRRARFTLAARPIPDLLAAESVVPVTFAQRNVMILFGSEPREDFECLKIAELARDRTGALKVVESWIPPVLRVDASPFIVSGIRTVLKVMIAKQRELARTRRQRDAAAVEFTGADVTRFLQLHALNTAIPALDHAVDLGELPPESLFLILVQLAGQLHSFSPDGDPTTLPKFQFTNLRATFEELFSRLAELLQRVALEQCLTVMLEVRADGVYRGRLQDERLAKCPHFILAVQSDLAERMVADQLPRLSKIASWEDMPGLLRSSMSGVPLQVTFRPPPQVPVRPGLVHFGLELDSPHWKNVLRDQCIAIYLPPPFDPGRTQVELLAVPGGGQP